MRFISRLLKEGFGNSPVRILKIFGLVFSGVFEMIYIFQILKSKFDHLHTIYDTLLILARIGTICAVGGPSIMILMLLNQPT